MQRLFFPKGPRSRNGHPKKFAATGLKILFKNAPEALVVPVTINNSWKLLQYGHFPMGVGIRITLEVHEPLSINKTATETLITTVEERVTSAIQT